MFQFFLDDSTKYKAMKHQFDYLQKLIWLPSSLLDMLMFVELDY